MLPFLGGRASDTLPRQGKHGLAEKGIQRGLKLRMLSGMQRLIVKEEGQDLVEYSLVLALIALATVASIDMVASAINNLLVGIGTALTGIG